MFCAYANNPRQLDPKNALFLLEGCHRLDPQHHIPDLVDKATLDQTLRKDNISCTLLKDFDEPKLLSVNKEITYLVYSTRSGQEWSGMRVHDSLALDWRILIYKT